MKLTKKIREVSKLIKEVETEIETLQNYFIMNNKKYYLKKGNLYESNDSIVSIGQIDRKGRISIFEGKTRKKTFILKNNSKRNNDELNKNMNENMNESLNNNTGSLNQENSKQVFKIQLNNKLNSKINNLTNNEKNNESVNKTDNKTNNSINIEEPDSPDFYNSTEKLENKTENKTETKKEINNLDLNDPPNKSIKEYHNQNDFGYSGLNINEMNEINEIGEFELR